MQISRAYGERVRRTLGEWALITEQSGIFAEDSRIQMIFKELAELESCHSYQTTLCADGSPIEFCERISQVPQAVAITFAPLQMAKDGNPPLKGLYRLLENLVSEGELMRLRTRLDRHAAEISSFWVGADLAQRKGVRIYCKLSQRAATEVAESLRAGGPVNLLELDFSKSTLQNLSKIVKRGILRIVALNFNADTNGIKLAFAYPLDRCGVDCLADCCGIPMDSLHQYMNLLSSSRGGWRHSRCGLAFALSEAGLVEGFTVYHYAAPYFRDDQELRAFVLRLAEHFS